MPLSQIVSASIEDGAVAPVDLSSVAQYTGFKNRLINGAFGIAQRGTSFTNLGSSAPAYGLDRWSAWRGSYVAGLSASQQTGFSGFTNCYRFGRAASNASLEPIYTSQIIESVNMLDLAGQTINLSFYARAGANFSATSSNLTVLVVTGTATNQTTTALSLGTWTGYANTGSLIQALTTTATQYTFSVAIPSNVQSMAVQFIYVPTGTAGASDYVEVTGVQLEKGTTATSFDYRPYGTELVLCQRYYEVMYSTPSGAQVVGLQRLASNFWAQWDFLVEKRAGPTVAITSAGSWPEGAPSFFPSLSYTQFQRAGTFYLANSLTNVAILTATAEL
jgi:hypothetical protein